MKLQDVEIGVVYEAKVGDRLTAVRVMRVYLPAPYHGGRYYPDSPRPTRYVGVNLRTGREVEGTAAKLRHMVPSADKAVAWGLLTHAEAEKARDHFKDSEDAARRAAQEKGGR